MDHSLVNVLIYNFLLYSSCGRRLRREIGTTIYSRTSVFSFSSKGTLLTNPCFVVVEVGQLYLFEIANIRMEREMQHVGLAVALSSC